MAQLVSIYRFDVLRTGGEEHRPIFTARCETSFIKRKATASSKKDAKQLAARAVLDVIQSESENQLAVAVLDRSEGLFGLNGEIRSSTPCEWTNGDPDTFYVRLNKDDRTNARTILMDTSGVDGIMNKTKMDAVCSMLKLEYKIADVVSTGSPYYKAFTLENGYDCVMIAKIHDLYDRVVEHFKIMLNVPIDEPM